MGWGTRGESTVSIMRTMYVTWCVVGAIVLAAAGGCSGGIALTSETHDDNGVIYHLPKTVLTVTVRQYNDETEGHIFYTLGGPGENSNGNVINEQDIQPQTIPDPRHRYVLKYHPDAFSDDRMCISRKPDGLLHDVQFAADDRTPQIAFNVAQFIGGFIGKPVGYRQSTLPGATSVVVRAYTGTLDPFEESTVIAFNNGLRSMFGEGVRVDVSRMLDMLEASASTWPEGCAQRKGSIKDDCPRQKWAERCDAGHICYRTKIDFPIYLIENGEAVDVKYAKVINAWDIGTISVTRARLVQKITKLRFEEGALVAAIIRKPSEVEEATLLPLNVMNAILSVPSGLWQGALADTTTKTALLQQMAKNEGAIAQLNANRTNMLLTGDTAPVTEEKGYQLNCRDSVAETGTLNLFP